MNKMPLLPMFAAIVSQWLRMDAVLSDVEFLYKP
jgi:hypothetical protein